MHFVKKTPATEAQRVAAEKKRKEKLKHYLELRGQAFAKCGNQQLDEELLKLTAEILTKHPDIYTFWNIRRKIIGVLREHQQDESDEAHSARQKKLFDDELSLTQEALLSNPKSYSTWHHRFWAFENHPAPNLQKELALCEKALMFDCRNFHCWDHRRSVAKLAKLTDSDELAFSDKLVGINPSNYSAWHYRGTLLLRTKPPADDENTAIDGECLEEEMKKITNVCCVNSEDQTAWTYCRWLQEAACEQDRSPLTVLSVSSTSTDSFQIVLNRATDMDKLSSMVKSETAFELQPISLFKAPDAKYQSVHVWLLKFTGQPAAFDVRTAENAEDWTTTSEQQPYVDKDALRKLYSMDAPCKSSKAAATLMELADMCKELMQMEEEQDNPSEIVSLSRTLLFLIGPTQETVATILEHFERVKNLDPHRKSMYEELSDSIRIAAMLHETDAETNRTFLQNLLEGGGHLSLRYKGIRSIYHLRFLSGLIRDLNLQGNNIIDTAQFRTFPSLTSLDLSENPLARIANNFDFPNLEFLNLASTQLCDVSAIAPLRANPSLRRLLLCSTKLVDDAEAVFNTLDAKERGLRIILHYL